ncbi:copper transporter [Brevibacillus sp. TJ4]|uniref:copper transporter n=1 Tax=Brevibacillus sp. TJ4 TaxID=3234853 RepID=UPI0037CDB13D
MIHFRYHLLSLVAVFIALGVGILLGGTVGQPWLQQGEKEVLARMEEKYDRALKSNNELKQQMKHLMQEVEQSNQEVIHLMAMRYANDLQGSKIYVWHSPEVQLERFTRVMNSLGMEVVPYVQGSPVPDGLLLLFAAEQPDWLGQLPADSRWLHVEQVPNSFARQWELLENVQKLLTEMRQEHEKS